MDTDTTTQNNAETKTHYKVGIVEDHTLMREGMELFVKNLKGFECVWQASSARDAMTLLQENEPDVMIVDITLPDRHGLELIKDVNATYPHIAILVVSMHEEELYARRALKAGARGYIMKSAPHDVLDSALRRVAEGGIAVSDAMSERILMAFSAGGKLQPDDGLHNLSDREFEVFQLISEGKSTHQIAEALRISTKTVDVHRMNIKNKLGLKDGSAVTRYAIRWCEARKHGAPFEFSNDE